MNKYAKSSDFSFVRRIIPVLILLSISTFYTDHAKARCDLGEPFDLTLGHWVDDSTLVSAGASFIISSVDIFVNCGGDEEEPYFYARVRQACPNAQGGECSWGQVTGRRFGGLWYQFVFESPFVKRTVWAARSANDNNRLEVVIDTDYKANFSFLTDFRQRQGMRRDLLVAEPG